MTNDIDKQIDEILSNWLDDLNMKPNCNMIAASKEQIRDQILIAIGNDAVECPHCRQTFDINQTGSFTEELPI